MPHLALGTPPPIPNAKSNPNIAEILNRHAIVHPIVQGVMGAVHYCILNSTLQSVSTTPSKAEIDKLRGSIVVVKIAYPVFSLQSKSGQAAKEVRILRALEAKQARGSSNPANAPSITLLDRDACEDTDVHWAVMKTTIPSITLPTLERFWRQRYGRFTIPFIAHTFLRLFAALEFLHTELECITHGEMHNKNIPIDFAGSSSQNAFPEVKLLDFEYAQALPDGPLKEKNDLVAVDISGLCGVMFQMVNKAPLHESSFSVPACHSSGPAQPTAAQVFNSTVGEHSNEWGDFVDLIRYASVQAPAAFILAEVRSRCGGFLESVRDSIPLEEQKKSGEHVEFTWQTIDRKS